MSEVAGPSYLLLSPSEISDIAQYVIRPMPCEWGECTVVLNSCYNLTQHVLRHCERISSIEGQYHCQYVRCAGRVHPTRDALKAHASLSHLSRLVTSCPIKDCEQEFSRASQLESHFKVDHKDLVDTRVTWSSERLVPTALPVRRVVTPPPPLPPQRELHLWNFTAPAISLPPRHKSRSPLVPVEPIFRKWRRLEVPDEEDKDAKPGIPLGDLVHPAVPPKDIVLNIQKKPPGSLSGNQRLSCPRSIPHPLPHDDRVPQTIGFSTLAKKFDSPAGLEDDVVNDSAIPDGGM